MHVFKKNNARERSSVAGTYITKAGSEIVNMGKKINSGLRKFTSHSTSAPKSSINAEQTKTRKNASESNTRGGAVSNIASGSASAAGAEVGTTPTKDGVLNKIVDKLQVSNPIVININFLGSGHPASKGAPQGSEQYGKYRHVYSLLQSNENKIGFTFSGPTTLDIGTPNIKSITKEAEEILTDLISKIMENKADGNKKVTINIKGHSRGGIVANRVRKWLRDQLWPGEVKLGSFGIADPYAGPVNLELHKSMRNFDNDLNIPNINSPQIDSHKDLARVLVEDRLQNERKGIIIGGARAQAHTGAAHGGAPSNTAQVGTSAPNLRKGVILGGARAQAHTGAAHGGAPSNTAQVDVPSSKVAVYTVAEKRFRTPARALESDIIVFTDLSHAKTNLVLDYVLDKQSTFEKNGIYVCAGGSGKQGLQELYQTYKSGKWDLGTKEQIGKWVENHIKKIVDNLQPGTDKVSVDSFLNNVSNDYKNFAYNKIASSGRRELFCEALAKISKEAAKKVLDYLAKKDKSMAKKVLKYAKKCHNGFQYDIKK